MTGRTNTPLGPDLKPCPFCGAAPVLHDATLPGHSKTVECPTDGCALHYVWPEVTNWNKRTVVSAERATPLHHFYRWTKDGMEAGKGDVQNEWIPASIKASNLPQPVVAAAKRLRDLEAEQMRGEPAPPAESWDARRERMRLHSSRAAAILNARFNVAEAVLDALDNQTPPSATQALPDDDDAAEALVSDPNVRHVPAPLSDCLRIMRARHAPGVLSPAEIRELEAAAELLELAYQALRELVQRIEKCGASVELTQAVMLASDLCSAIGNRWNPRDKNRERMVRAALDANSDSASAR